jgi:hypothetical protein
MKSLLCLMLMTTACCYPQGISAQTSPPGTDIYLAPLTWTDGKPAVGNPVNVTRRAGYDNQPSFSFDGTFFLYTCMDTSGQTDIYRYDIERGVSTQLTDTQESEYSPTMMTGEKRFSTVRVEADGTQRLWRFDLDGSNPRLILTTVDSVGYHAWLGDEVLGLFVLGEPHTLRIAEVKKDADRIVEFNIGRCLQVVPGASKISFVHKMSEDQWRIKRYDPAAGEFEDLAHCLPGSEDYVWTPGGDILMAEGAALFIWTWDDAWAEVAGFSEDGLKRITRLAVDPRGRWLALVADEE